MSRHEGVSCDSCSKRNFRGRRYKCLLCYDYDLCATCYEAGATTPRHTTEHPVQCILTRSDFDMYYGGESLTVEQPQSFTCPYCAKMGFTEATLQEHVTSEHSEASAEVVCPVCASLPGGDPNLVTDDLSGHLNLEHRSGRSDLISFLDEPSGLRHGIRRAPHASRGGVGSRPRRCNMHFTTSGGLSSISPSSQTSDPIAELLSQLSGVRRSAASVSGQGSTPSQLQQLQIQLQLERQQVRAARQQLERLPRRQTQPASSNSASNAGSGPTTSAAAVANSTATAAADLGSSLAPPANLQFLLARCTEPALTEAELQAAEQERADHSLFVQELVLSTLTEATASLLSPSSSGVVPSKSGGSSEACSSSRESPGGGGGARIQPPPPPPQASPSPSPSPAPPPAPAPTPPAPPAPSSSYSTSSNSPSSSVASATQQKTSAASAVSKRSSTRGSVAGSSPVTGSSSGARMPQPAQPALQQLWEGVTRPIVSLQDQPSPPQPQPLRVVTGTGTIREVVGAAYGTPATNRRKPVRTATEPPPPH